MCTASWSLGQGELSLCFNRDELKTRGEASPPEVIEIGGMKMLAAIDVDAGGTWLAVNERGVCVFLLNNYGAQAVLAEPPISRRSRGELPLEFASYATRAAAVEAFAGAALGNYSPFLIAFADREGIDIFSWDGSSAEGVDRFDGFATTSAYRTDEVQGYRESRYVSLLAGRRRLDGKERRELHLGTPHPDSAFNLMMLRDESRTRSVSTVEVSESVVTYRYEAVLGESRRLGEVRSKSLSFLQQ